MKELEALQTWYRAQCNGDWEHQNGIVIETLDNPGWSVRIDLGGTALAEMHFVELSDLTPEVDWYRCWVENGSFLGVGGPMMLGLILERFLGWAQEHAVLP